MRVDHQNVAGVQELQDGAERLAALGRGAAALLRTDDLAAGRLERRFLDRQVLIGCAYPRIADDGYGNGLMSRLALAACRGGY
jgi:hypothetical protein